MTIVKRHKRKIGKKTIVVKTYRRKTKPRKTRRKMARLNKPITFLPGDGGIVISDELSDNHPSSRQSLAGSQAVREILIQKAEIDKKKDKSWKDYFDYLERNKTKLGGR